jgi:hypothetical protein
LLWQKQEIRGLSLQGNDITAFASIPPTTYARQSRIVVIP